MSKPLLLELNADLLGRSAGAVLQTDHIAVALRRWRVACLAAQLHTAATGLAVRFATHLQFSVRGKRVCVLEPPHTRLPELVAELALLRLVRKGSEAVVAAATVETAPGWLTVSYTIYVQAGTHVYLSAAQRGAMATLSQYTPDPSPVDARHLYLVVAASAAALDDTAATVDAAVPGLFTELLPFQRNTVLWMIHQETTEKPMFGWRQAPGYWHNPLTGQVLSSPDQIPQSAGAAAVLAEEMGLGKTIEVAALVLLNPRPAEEVGTTFPALGTGRAVTRAATSLILLPHAILQQWEDEFAKWTSTLVPLRYPGMTDLLRRPSNAGRSVNSIRAEWTAKLLAADVVVALYGTIASEYHYAQYSARNRSRRARKRLGTEDDADETCPDYSSPLTLIEFHRVVLDEAQMVLLTQLNPAQVTQMIPRRHSWAVSGTPVKAEIADLHGILLLLQLEPFRSYPGAFPALVQDRWLFDALWSDISIRHTKLLVAHQVVLPPQRRTMLALPLTAVEQNQYDHVLEECLSTIGYDAEGNVVEEVPRDEVMASMRRYLVRLRQLCCHPQAKTAVETDPGAPPQTVEEVLQAMIQDVEHQLQAARRGCIQGEIRLGQLNESEGKYEEALGIWAKQLPVVEEAVAECHSSDDPALRPSLELLHLLLFFIASAHFRMYNPVGEADLNDVEDEALEPWQLEHRKLEVDYYARAEVVRQRMLSESLAKVHEATARSQLRWAKQTFRFEPLPETKFPAPDPPFQVLEVYALEANRQAALFNRVIVDTTKLLHTPVALGDSADGTEYELLLAVQDQIAVHLDTLHQMLHDRRFATDGLLPLGDAPESQAAVFKEAVEARPLACATHLLLFERNLLKARFLVDGGGEDELEELAEAVDRDRRSATALFREVAALNRVYNTRVQYYKQLQAISDSVTAETQVLNADRIQTQSSRDQAVVARLLTRRRYLQLLQQVDADESECVICREVIELGCLLGCGHRFCADCWTHWQKHHRACPMCKQPVVHDEVYRYSRRTGGVEAVEAVETATSPTPTATPAAAALSLLIHRIYQQVDQQLLGTTRATPLVSRFGSKIDLIVQHVLHLRNRDPEAQIVVFSQWAVFLQMVAHALDANNVRLLSLLQTARAGRKKLPMDAVAQFKTDTLVACFLLHARDQAAGLTLVNALHVFLCEPFVNTGLELQAISRVHRIGQKRETTVWMFVVQHTVEEAIARQATERRVRLQQSGGGVAGEESATLAQSLGGLADALGEHVVDDDLFGCFFDKS